MGEWEAVDVAIGEARRGATLGWESFEYDVVNYTAVHSFWVGDIPPTVVCMACIQQWDLSAKSEFRSYLP